MMTEQWDKYYAVTFDGEVVCEGDYGECADKVYHAFDDDCAQMFEVTTTAKEIIL